LHGLLKPTGKPDADNIAKIVGDALNGVVWVDDSQIVLLTIRKMYAEEGKVTVNVEEV
jgi:Holliday junction resolvase RusA-like endonuclease